MMSLKKDLDIECSVDNINRSSHDEAQLLNSCVDVEISGHLSDLLNGNNTVKIIEKNCCDFDDSSVISESTKQRKRHSFLASDNDESLLHHSTVLVAESTCHDSADLENPCADMHVHMCQHCNMTFTEKAWFYQHMLMHNEVHDGIKIQTSVTTVHQERNEINQCCMMSLKKDLYIECSVDNINRSSQDDTQLLNSCVDVEISEHLSDLLNGNNTVKIIEKNCCDFDVFEVMQQLCNVDQIDSLNSSLDNERNVNLLQNADAQYETLTLNSRLGGGKDVDDELSSSSNTENNPEYMISLKQDSDVKFSVDNINQDSHEEPQSLNNCLNAELSEHLSDHSRDFINAEQSVRNCWDVKDSSLISGSSKKRKNYSFWNSEPHMPLFHLPTVSVSESAVQVRNHTDLENQNCDLPFHQCQQCYKTFTKKGWLHRHMQKHHEVGDVMKLQKSVEVVHRELRVSAEVMKQICSANENVTGNQKLLWRPVVELRRLNLSDLNGIKSPQCTSVNSHVENVHDVCGQRATVESSSINVKKRQATMNSRLSQSSGGKNSPESMIIVAECSRTTLGNLTASIGGQQSTVRKKRCIQPLVKQDRRPYVCYMCHLDFPTKSNLLTHIVRHKANHEETRVRTISSKELQSKVGFYGNTRPQSGEKPYVCTICNRACVSKSHLIIHRRTHTGDKPFVCAVCNKAFVSKSSLACHRIIHTGEKPYVCTICSKAFAMKVRLVRHQSVHTGERPYACTICNNVYSSKSYLVIHERIHTGEKPHVCTICNKAFANNSALVAHKRIHTSEQPYVCAVCNAAFSIRGNLVRHCKSVHFNEKPYLCTLCNKAFALRVSLINHKRVHTGEKPYACTKCNKAFKSRVGFLYHKRVHTGEKPQLHVCTLCNRTFASRTGLVYHKLSHTGEKPHVCTICNKAFASRSGLDSHKQVHTGKKPCVCSICNKAFPCKNGLLRHKLVHTGEKPYVCALCNTAFSERGNLIRHRKSVHFNEKPYLCTLCNKAFALKESLVNHKRVHTDGKPFACTKCNKAYRSKLALVCHNLVHTGEKPHVCKLCNKAFTSRNGLAYHKLVHAGEKPYRCTICSYGCASEGNLAKHTRIHTGEKPYVCAICYNGFAEKCNLVSHQRTHTGEKPYVCAICYNGFADKSSLVSHQRIHTGEKPYVCTICDKAFACRSNLCIHVRLHTGEKPHVCTICNKAFAEKCNLVSHQRIHTGEKPYVCTICSKTFSHRGNLIKHMRFHTKETLLV